MNWNRECMLKDTRKKIKHISYSFGMVDLVHFGHIMALKRASEGADLTVFGLVSDSAADAWFGVHVSNEQERRAVVESIRFVDCVMPQTTFDPIDNLRYIHGQYPNAEITLFHGNEWGMLSAKKYLESIGGHVIKLNYYEKLSLQKIFETMNINRIEQSKINGNLISTKANTLFALRGLLSKSKIEDIFILTIEEYKANNFDCARKISEYFKSSKIVVRSSSRREDAFEDSNAGHFRSVLDVLADDLDSVCGAISEVIASYGEDAEPDEQILIQRQTENVMVSGVIFTRDIKKNRPYYVINYDDSGSTDSVTSGAGGKTCWLSDKISREAVPEKWQSLMEAVKEIEAAIPDTLLDIEFCITKKEVVIFQVRPLAAAYKFGRISGSDNKEVLKTAIQRYDIKKKQGLTMYSDMAFWNPAEIIGDNPKFLDYSLYRYIITKKAWDEGIAPLGYRSVPKELMYKFGNKPYINLERSFEALTPARLSDDFAKKLNAFYIERLKKNLSAHDKIEFEISYNCYDFSLHERLQELKTADFTEEECTELKSALFLITVKTICEYEDTLAMDLVDLRKLETVRLDVQNITKDCINYQILSKSVHNLLDAITRFGTPQFSRHARCAFMAKSIGKSLVKEGYLDAKSYEEFMSGIHTIAVDYCEDYQKVLEGNMDKETFLSIYGHLREGTYNIRSPRYDELDFLFKEPVKRRKGGKAGEKKKESGGAFDDALMAKALDKALGDHGISELTGSKVVAFIRDATEQREFFKFIFTKSLSFAMDIIKALGSVVGISLNDLSYLEISEIFSTEYYSDMERLSEFWSLIIRKRKELFTLNENMILPSVICCKRDFSYIEEIASRPNYITESRITADVCVLNGSVAPEDVEGKIVCVEKADPGYDWLFSKNIAGLITKYGGVASHMAIRCAEFRIPAAIGCGNALYDFVQRSKQISLDCKNEMITKEA